MSDPFHVCEYPFKCIYFFFLIHFSGLMILKYSFPPDYLASCLLLSPVSGLCPLKGSQSPACESCLNPLLPLLSPTSPFCLLQILSCQISSSFSSVSCVLWVLPLNPVFLLCALCPVLVESSVFWLSLYYLLWLLPSPSPCPVSSEFDPLWDLWPFSPMFSEFYL